MATFTVHAGHNPSGMIASGAVGLLNESDEARKICNEVIRLFRLNGHTAYDCTVNDGISQADVLNKIVAKCNSHMDAEADLSIHLNTSAGGDPVGDGKNIGTETWTYSSTVKANVMSKRITDEIAKLGYRNRGVKHNPGLAFLKGTKKEAILIETLFLNDRDDVNLYNYKTMAQAIVKGALGVNNIKTDNNPTPVESRPMPDATSYHVKVTADVLNIRKGPGANHVVIGQIKDKGTYTIVEESNGWGKLKSGAGWISLAYTNKKSLATNTSEYPYVGKCTGSNVNVRSGPGTGYKSLRKLNVGNLVDVLDKSGDWYKVNIVGLIAYVHSDYIVRA